MLGTLSREPLKRCEAAKYADTSGELTRAKRTRSGRISSCVRCSGASILLALPNRNETRLACVLTYKKSSNLFPIETVWAIFFPGQNLRIWRGQAASHKKVMSPYPSRIEMDRDP